MTDRARVLVVEDAAEYQQLISSALSEEGFGVEVVDTGEEGVELARSGSFAVLVLDVSLPGIDGFEVCRRVREHSDAFILMLTSRTDELDRVVGLSVGADDYVTKPFYPRELRARVQALLRRARVAPPTAPAAAEASGSERQFDALVIDPDRREVRVDDRDVELTRVEFDVLDALTASPGRVLSRSQLLERVWGPTWFGDEHVIDVHVSNLRKKLGDDPRTPRYIKTVRGVGFRMATERSSRS